MFFDKVMPPFQLRIFKMQLQSSVGTRMRCSCLSSAVYGRILIEIKVLKDLNLQLVFQFLSEPVLVKRAQALQKGLQPKGQSLHVRAWVLPSVYCRSYISMHLAQTPSCCIFYLPAYNVIKMYGHTLERAVTESYCLPFQWKSTLTEKNLSLCCFNSFSEGYH